MSTKLSPTEARTGDRRKLNFRVLITSIAIVALVGISAAAYFTA